FRSLALACGAAECCNRALTKHSLLGSPCMSGSIRVSDTRLPRLFAAALLVLALPVAAGELYQWKDANGVTHYSDSPPPAGEYENRIIGNSGSAGTAAKPEEAAVENEQCTMAR